MNLAATTHNPPIASSGTLVASLQKSAEKMSNVLRLYRILLLAAGGVVACSGPEAVAGRTSDTGPLAIKSERDTTAEADTLVVGDAGWLFVRGADTTAPTIWSVNDTSVVRISEQNFSRVQIRALRTGNAILSAQYESETATFTIVVRDLQASDTAISVFITTNADSGLVGDTIPFGFQLISKRDVWNNRPFTLTLSDSTVVRVMPRAEHYFLLEALKLGQVVLTISCDCVSASKTITVYEPPPTVPDPRASHYEAIDLGTLGGAAAIPLALNDSGDVVGSSLTADGKQHAFVWTNGVMQDLSPSAEAQSEASNITNGGSIAGISLVGDAQHVILWQNGQATDLGTVGAGDSHAEVVGMTELAVVASGYYGSAIWQNGTKQSLSGFRAVAINSQHQIAGMLGQTPSLWDNGIMRALDAPDPLNKVIDLNSAGAVLGETEGNAYLAQLMVIWVNGQVTLLGGPHAVAINDGGDAVGELNGSAWFYAHDGGALDVPSLGPGHTFVEALNNRAMVVGSSWTTAKKQHAFVWQPSEATSIDLGTGPVAIDRMGSAATALNAHGDIIGWIAPCITPSGRCTALDMSRARAILWRLK
jgi:probable HAF family extracellular repeat protein